MNDTLLLFGFPTTPLELLSFVLAALTVLLNIRQVHWAWLFSIIASATYALVFFDARLYGDMGLQLVFIAVSVWGWYQWLSGAGRGDNSALPVSRLRTPGLVWGALGWLAGFVVLSYFLRVYTDTDVPHADGFLTAGSLVGQLLLSRKKLENWHVWIVVDLLYVALYIHKDLWVTAVLYAAYVLMAVAGLRAWSRADAVAATASDPMVLK
jgi:nicotinamide mononucleotide transporter